MDLTTACRAAGVTKMLMKPGTGDLDLRDEIGRGQRGDERLRDVARLALQRLRMLERDVGREVAVLGLLRPVELDRGAAPSGAIAATPMAQQLFQPGSEIGHDGPQAYHANPSGSTSSATRTRRPRQHGDRGAPLRRKRCIALFSIARASTWPALEPGSARQRRPARAQTLPLDPRLCARRCDRLRWRLPGKRRPLRVRRPRGQQGETRERRKRRRAALRKQLFGEAFVIVRDQRASERMRREVRLHDHLAREVRATRATRHLEQERGEPLRRAEIAAVERVVGAEHADEREPGEIVSFGEHLRAHENVDFAGVNAIANARRRRPLRFVLSRSMRAIRACGNRSASARSSRCVPWPSGTSPRCRNRGMWRKPLDVPAMGQRKIRGFRGARPSRALQRGHPPAIRTPSTAARRRSHAG
jgi:hypothetical protein